MKLLLTLLILPLFAQIQLPSLGDPNAKIHIVAFLEPKCPDSARFVQEIYPHIQEELIATNRVNYAVMIVSFLKGSMPAANALYCVYHQDTNSFFAFLNTLYAHLGEEDLMETLVAKAQEASPTIDAAQLSHCMDLGTYVQQIEENTAVGRELMGRLTTPSVFINGIKVAPLTWEEVEKQIARYD